MSQIIPDGPDIHFNEEIKGDNKDFDLFDALVNYFVDTNGEKSLPEAKIHLTVPSDTGGIEKFSGACLDFGAQRSIVGKSQAEA